jgi:hypothetical protein
MTTRLFLLLALTLVSSLAATAQVPSTDVFVFDVTEDGLGDPRLITDREGYDNQPRFLPGGEALVYSSLRHGQTDIYLHRLDRGETVQVTHTDESEYSPTPIPGTDHLSLVRDYGDLKQQLWSVALDGSDVELLLPDVTPVGYHAWVDEESVVLFVLGEPHTLQSARIGPGPGKKLADSPGRGLARMPGGELMSYVDKQGTPWWLTAIDPETGSSERLIATPEDREDYAWAADGSIWLGDDSRLLRWHPDEGGDWKEIADLDRHGVYGITRVTFSDDGKRLAVVGQRPPADLAAAYRAEAGQIIGASLTDVEGWEKLNHLATVIGHRLSGSTALAAGVKASRSLNRPAGSFGSSASATASGRLPRASPRRSSSCATSMSSRLSVARMWKARSSSMRWTGEATAIRCVIEAAVRRVRQLWEPWPR